VSATALARSVSRKRAPSSTLQVMRVEVGSRSSSVSSGSGPASRSERGLCESSSFSVRRSSRRRSQNHPGWMWKMGA
jgi:hypothetical protein